MEFWGVEVKAGQPLKVKPNFDNIIHLSQASLGESKKEKGHDSVPLFVKFGDKKLVLGTLIPENIPQLSFDLVFEKEFELSHNWKNGSIYFCGYQTPLPMDSSDEFDMGDSDEEEQEELPSITAAAENGKAGQKAEKAKAATPMAIPAAKPAKLIKDVKPKEDGDDESDDEDDSDDEMVDGDDSDEISGEDDSDDDDEDDSEDDEDSDEDEKTPKKPEVGKKRPTESATKTPVPAKKAKTPMSDGKKGVHVATPHPSKGVKTPNAKTQTPKSGGQVTCSSCSKTFNSDNALQSHTKAKHSAK
ncbi:hypothetical protein WN944_027668 [Citrus x changshan-huyou]|uniref:C2H2-type domain-containing protein n=3 Tax=Citrus TaxID=2706 RepID=A0ACB8ISD0_CITSI|nr:histone deacetylase HDT2 [Citrus x clementina]ESR37584.1 hypothetical protein CICLE_v10028932mg [Citrus x clementina]KAH9699992.1 C2H2-type domain-containing protein [Citrus sinensis]